MSWQETSYWLLENGVEQEHKLRGKIGTTFRVTVESPVYILEPCLVDTPGTRCYSP